MKLLISLMALSFSLVSCSGSDTKNQDGNAIAAFASGTYVGTGKASALGLEEKCTNIRLTLSSQADKMTIEERAIYCGTYQSVLQKPLTLDIRGNDLYYKNASVGSINGEKIQFTYSQDGYKVAVLFQPNTTSYTYNESWTAADPTENLQVSSTLKKQ